MTGQARPQVPAIEEQEPHLILPQFPPFVERSRRFNILTIYAHCDILYLRRSVDNRRKDDRVIERLSGLSSPFLGC
jgi:hypothetical protein